MNDVIHVGIEAKIEMRHWGILARIRSGIMIRDDLKVGEVFKDVGVIR